MKAAVSGAELEAGNGGIAITADNTAKINVKALTASVAAGFGGSNSIAVSGGGAGASNIVNVDVEASATDSTLDSAGLMKVAALGDFEITATIAAISVAATAGNKGFGVSIGAAAAVNRIGDWNVTGAIVRSQAVSGSSAENLAPDQAEDDDTSIPAPVATERVLPNGNATMTETSGVKAFLSNTTVEGGGDLSVTATSSGKIDATVAAASVALALGSTGAGISAGGVYVLNFIGVDTAAYVDNTDGNDIDADDIAITASDSTEIDVLAGAASLAGGFGASNGVAVSIGFAMADNTTKGAVEAYLRNVDDVSATGAISVGATNSANIDATAATASISAAIGGTNGISFSGGGAVARNDILTDTSAFIEGSAGDSGGIPSRSQPHPRPSSTPTYWRSRSPSALAEQSAERRPSGQPVALNNIGNGAADRNKVEAYVRGSGITTAGLLSLQATSSQTIKARVAAGSAAIGGGTVGVGMSAAGVGGHNTIAVRTAAFIDGAAKTITAGSIDIDAIDTSDIDAFAGAASLAAGFGTTAVAVTIGVSIALNEIDNDVYAGISGDQIGRNDEWRHHDRCDQRRQDRSKILRRLARHRHRHGHRRRRAVRCRRHRAQQHQERHGRQGDRRQHRQLCRHQRQGQAGIRHRRHHRRVDASDCGRCVRRGRSGDRCLDRRKLHRQRHSRPQSGRSLADRRQGGGGRRARD